MRFGENYVQEAIEKMEQLQDLAIEWHYIGGIQSNKTRLIAQSFAWVHGVASLKHARRLSEQRPSGMPPLNICLQINISGESSKQGITPEKLRSSRDIPFAEHSLARPHGPARTDRRQPATASRLLESSCIIRRTATTGMISTPSRWACPVIWKPPSRKDRQWSESALQSLVPELDKMKP